MFDQVANWAFNAIFICIRVCDSLVLAGDITFLDFLIFVMLFRILLFLLDFLKQTTIVANENANFFKVMSERSKK